MEHLLEYRTVAQMLRHGSQFGEIDNVFAIAHFKRDSILCDAPPTSDTPHYAGKFPGIAMLLVVDDQLDIEINSEQYHASANSLVVLLPGSVARIRHTAGPLKGDGYVLFLSHDFMHDININHAVIGIPNSPLLQNPVIKFDADQAQLLCQYFELLLGVSKRSVSPRLDRNIASSIITALVYQINQLMLINAELRLRNTQDGTRPSSYVHDFMHLVKLNYMRERSVQYYANQLHISPKYLSLLVRKATGRTASRWIDEFVIMEARNLLRFSDKNIQQIAYMLNFANQSAFGKYFKQITGMSPTEYQKR